MHECPDCGQTCDCDGEDVWNDWAGRTCRHACDDEDDVLYLDDHAWSKESNRPFLSPELREFLGQRIREAWVTYCIETKEYKPSHIVPWEHLSEWDKEADRRIADAIFAWLGPQSATVGRFELRIEDGRRFWWGSENGWKDATEIGENGVLTLDAAAFAIGTVLTLTEPTEEPTNPLAEKLGISIEKAGVWRITPDGLERIEEQPVIRCEAINPRWTGKPRRKWKLRRKRGGIA